MNTIEKITIGTDSAYLQNMFISKRRGGSILFINIYHTSITVIKAMYQALKLGAYVRYGCEMAYPGKEDYTLLTEKVMMGRSSFYKATIINKNIGKKYLLTDNDSQYEDIYQFLLSNFDLPLVKEWVNEIVDKLVREGNITYGYGMETGYSYDESSVSFKRGDNYINIPMKDLVMYDFSHLDEGTLEETVSSLIRNGRIKVANEMSEPLSVKDMDEYTKKYGNILADNVAKEYKSLIPLNGTLESFSAKKKRLFPQQAACTNGAVALLESGSKYVLMVEGMGCGKTLQGAAVADSYANRKWLKNHPGKTLKDMYLSDDGPSYRNVMMAPSHLVEKWKDELLEEVPGAKVEIVKTFEQLLKIKERGIERNGREWILMSKDFAKLSYQCSPIPNKTGFQIMKVPVCKACLTERDRQVMKPKGIRANCCPECGGKEFTSIPVTTYGKTYGMVCPCCGELLVKPSEKMLRGEGESIDFALTPASFAKRTSDNEVCFNCGTRLWGVDCKPVGMSESDAWDKKAWMKISHYTNHARKGKTTAYVLRDYVMGDNGKRHLQDRIFSDSKKVLGRYVKDYLSNTCVESDADVSILDNQFGPRRYAPSSFIKKYLKGYFDFCILDECHKYESGGSAQSIAAHALIKASDKVVGLTGTITNGRADSLFYLLYMLEPSRMKKMGYDHNNVMDFSKTYGAIETVYDGEDFDSALLVKNSSSRGNKIISQPKVKPGISPKLFTDFLLDRAVFLDLSDMSKYLPQLIEKVVPCETPEEVQASYGRVIENLKAAMKDGAGRGVMATMLQFGLSYPDKPYGFKTIRHPYNKDEIVSEVPSIDKYRDGVLLPKEKELVKIVRDEMEHDRNIFLYCAYTGKEETNITGRLKDIVERECNLKGKVLIMKAESPSAEKREEYIHQMAAEGIKVFICNMRLVETGLDFCFKHEGRVYNYPTIIFYQLTYELAVMWQASRRHYRLNQHEECHTYYLCSEGTLQQAAVSIMAEKQVAASAIQGKFSAEGLASMANGIDPRLKLAQMLSDGDMGESRESLSNMFDVMNQTTNAEDTTYDGFNNLTYGEVMGDDIVDVTATITDADEGSEDDINIFNNLSIFETLSEETTEKKPVKKEKSVTDDSDFDFNFNFDFGFGFEKNDSVEKADDMTISAPVTKGKKKVIEGQLDIFAAFAA